MSTPFTVFETTTGRVAFCGTADDLGALASAEQSIHIGEQYSGGWMDNGVHHIEPTAPSPHHVFDWSSKQWIDPRTLQDLKAAQWTQIKQSRSQAEYAGFTWDGSVFDSDAISQNRITGAVTLAQLSPSFTIDWTLQNNTARTLNQAQMLQVGAALGGHVQTQFAKGQALRAQIDAATTQAEVEAVVW